MITQSEIPSQNVRPSTDVSIFLLLHIDIHVYFFIPRPPIST